MEKGGLSKGYGQRCRSRHKPITVDDVWGQKEKSQRGRLRRPQLWEHTVVGVYLLIHGARQ